MSVNLGPNTRISSIQAEYLSSEEYIRSVELLCELGPKSDLDRILIRLDSYDIRLCEQNATVGGDDQGFIVEVTGAFGTKVATVLEKYILVAHMTEADSIAMDEILRLLKTLQTKASNKSPDQ